jgi:hypothetical protein
MAVYQDALRTAPVTGRRMAVAGRPRVEGSQREEGIWRPLASPLAVVSRT